MSEYIVMVVDRLHIVSIIGFWLSAIVGLITAIVWIIKSDDAEDLHYGKYSRQQARKIADEARTATVVTLCAALLFGIFWLWLPNASVMNSFLMSS